MVEGEQIYGDGVNVAARAEHGTNPGGVFISGFVRDQVKGRLAFKYQDLWECSLESYVLDDNSDLRGSGEGTIRR